MPEKRSIEERRDSSARGRRYLDRRYLVEPIAASLLLLPALPLWLLIALALRIDSPGPVLFRQERPGRDGTTFTIMKFRTMDVERAREDSSLVQQGDRRITRVGRILRRTHLDEIPQLLNVLRGEMSLIGPRPDPLLHSSAYEREYPPYRDRRQVRPGITGLGQIRVGYTHNLEGARRKLRYDLEYIQKASPRLDLKIVLGTIGLLFSGRGAR